MMRENRTVNNAVMYKNKKVPSVDKYYHEVSSPTVTLKLFGTLAH